MQQITIKKLWSELEKDPDLRRLGPYKIILEGGRPVFPIVVPGDLEGKDVHLGDGDYTEAFTALDRIKPKSLDLGSCKFTDLYLDYLEAGTLKFSYAEASRLYFDYAKIESCEFNKFVCPAIYFDLAEIEKVFMQDLKSGVLSLDNVKIKDVIHEEPLEKKYKFLVNSPESTKTFGDYDASEEKLTGDKNQEVKKLTFSEFIKELQVNPNMERLGRYQIIPSGNDESFRVGLNFSGQNINLGEGDFTLFPLSLSGLATETINFKRSSFSQLNLGDLVAERLDFSQSQVGKLHFDSAKIGRCFLSELEGHKIDGGQSDIGYFFGEEARVDQINFRRMVIEHLDVSNLTAEEFRLGESRIRRMFMSRGDRVQRMYFDESTLELLNLHEASLKEIRFGNSEIGKALLNKASAEIVEVEGLKTELFYVGNYKNELGKLNFGRASGVNHVEIEEILPKPKPRPGHEAYDEVYLKHMETEGVVPKPESERESLSETKRKAFGEISFGEIDGPEGELFGKLKKNR